MASRSSQRRETRELYRRWVLANGIAEAAGLGTTIVLGTMLAPALAAASGLVEIVGGAAVAIVLGTVLEGVVVGAAQGHVLARHSAVRPADWIRASAQGAGLAWTLGMTPSTVIALASGNAGPGDAASLSGPGPLATLMLAAGLGAVTGPILGAMQWRVLDTAVPGARRWLWANAAAWTVGMPVVFGGMDLVPWTGPLPLQVAAIYLVCAIAGLSVGAVHGRVLVDLLSHPAPAPLAAANAAPR